MATNFVKTKKGLNLDATAAASTSSAEGDISWDGTNHKLEFHDGTAVRKTVSENATQTLTNKTLSGNTATTLISGSGTLTLNTSGTATVPNATDTLVGKNTTDVLTNKTLSGNTAVNLISGSGTLTLNTTGTMTLPNATDTVVGKATTDVLTNKTLSGNTATTLISGSGTLTLNTSGTVTLPNATDTLVGKTTTDTLTNKTLTTPVIASITSGSGTFNPNTTGTITVPNATDTLVGKATTDTLTNKTLTSPTVNTPSVTTATFTDSPILTQIATPSTPSSGFNKIYPKSDGYFYSLDPSGSERKIGAGAGAINYILNPDAEGSTTGWATYADAAGTSPVDGTGGSPTTTWTRSTSSPLRGTGSFLLTKDAANRQGEGASYAFTIDSADQAKPIAVSFDYTVGSGTYADGDLTVWLYDVTNSTVIQPAPSSILSVATGLSQKWSGYFQTASASTSYRLIAHVTSTSASAYTVKFDNFSVGSTYQSYGTVTTDWIAYTPTFVGYGTVTSPSFYSRRVGDSLQVHGSFTTGTVTGTANQISIGFNGANANVTVDTAKISANSICGNGGVNVANTTTFSWNILAPPSNATYVQLSVQNSTATGLTALQNGNTVAVSSQAANVNFIVPIVGWSSNVQVSSDTDTRVVSLKATGTAASATSANPIIVPTVSHDTHGGYNASTGRYTAPISGIYAVQGAGTGNANSIDVSIYVDAVLDSIVGTTQNPNQRLVFAGTVKVNAGQVIDIRPNGTVTLGSMSLNIFRLSGPSQVAASERVYAFYTNNGGTALTINTTNLDWNTKVQDSHLAFNGTTFTAPRAGWYNVSGSAFTTAGVTATLSFYVNATIKQALGGGTSARVFPIVFGYYLNSGDALTIRSDTTATLSNSSTLHWLSISSQSGA